MTKKQKETSEFGKGLSYCLGLFLCHAERTDNIGTDEHLWFNGASDHLYELVIPKNYPLEIKNRLLYLQEKCLHLGHGFNIKFPATKEDRTWAIKEAMSLLLEIDKLAGINSIKGDFE